MINNGWVVLHRKFLEWEWYDDTNTKILFLHIILKANWKDKKWRGIVIKRGSFVTSLAKLSKETGLGVQQVRTSISKLELTHEITYQPTSQYTLLILNNYDKYQDKPTHEITSDQQASNKRVTTTNKDNKDNKDNKSIGDKPHGNKDVISLKKFLIKNYPITLQGITDNRALWNLIQVMTPRKGLDDWMDEGWKENFKKFITLYIKETDREYLVRSVGNLKEKAKLWREYRGKLN